MVKVNIKVELSQKFWSGGKIGQDKPKLLENGLGLNILVRPSSVKHIEHSSLLCMSTNPVSECARCRRSLGLLHGSAVICVGGKMCCSLLLYVWHSQLHILKVTSQ